MRCRPLCLPAGARRTAGTPHAVAARHVTPPVSIPSAGSRAAAAALHDVQISSRFGSKRSKARPWRTAAQQLIRVSNAIAIVNIHADGVAGAAAVSERVPAIGGAHGEDCSSHERASRVARRTIPLWPP